MWKLIKQLNTKYDNLPEPLRFLVFLSTVLLCTVPVLLGGSVYFLPGLFMILVALRIKYLYSL